MEARRYRSRLEVVFGSLGLWVGGLIMEMSKKKRDYRWEMELRDFSCD